MTDAKLLAKNRIRGERLKSFSVALISRLALALCGGLPYIFMRIFNSLTPVYAKTLSALLSLSLGILICSTFRMGREKYFFALAEKGRGKLRDVFYYFTPSRILRAVKVWSLYYAVHSGRFLLLSAPCAASVYAVYYYLKAHGLSRQAIAYCAVWSALLLAADIFFVSLFNSGDFMYFRIAVEQQEISPVRAMKKSRRYMETRLKKASRFRAGFIPLMLLCAFTIPGAFVYRYYKTSCCIYALGGIEG